MKTLISTIFVLSFLLVNTSGTCVENDNQTGDQPAIKQQTLQIVCSPELIDLTSSWVAGFGKLHPGQKIDVVIQSEETTLQKGNLYFLANSHSSMENKETAWKMVIGHDLVVPVINIKNPLLAEINKEGLTADDFARLLSGDSDWSAFIEGASKTPVQCYITEDQNVISRLADFSKTEKESMQTTKVNTASELIAMVQKNVNAIGFCSLTDALNFEKNTFASQISILPIDKNKNGRIDSFENIYANPATLTKGAWIGKYPREMCGEIFAVSTVKPENQIALDFLVYATTEGQNNIKKSGYSILSSTEKTANLLALAAPVSSSPPAKRSQLSTFSWILIFSIPIPVIFLIVLSGYKRGKKTLVESDDIEITATLNENSILAPAGLYYDKTHTWAFMEQDGMVKIGIDDFLNHVVGLPTQVKMKSPGEKVRKGDKILTIIHDGKQLNIYSPISGFIRKQNESPFKPGTKINNTTFTNRWIYQIEPGNWAREVNFMFMIDKYREWLKDEFTRLKDFLAYSANSNQVVYQHIVLQDGGELKDEVLADLGPEVWEDFQTHFIDTSK